MGIRTNSIEATHVAHVLRPCMNAAVHEKEGPLVISHTRFLVDPSSERSFSRLAKAKRCAEQTNQTIDIPIVLVIDDVSRHRPTRTLQTELSKLYTK